MDADASQIGGIRADRKLRTRCPWTGFLLTLMLCIGLYTIFDSALALDGQAASVEHDAAGRISRIAWPDGGVRYRYDTWGNLLAVESAHDTHAPNISSVEPRTVRAATDAQFVLVGEHLSAVFVDGPAGLSARIITASDTQLVLAVTAERGLNPGVYPVGVANDDGAASFDIEVLPPLPRLLLRPLPVALADDGIPAEIVVTLSNADVEPRDIALAIGNPALVDLLDTRVSIAAGATEGRVRLRGLAPGLTQLRLTAVGLDPAVFTVYVSAEASALNSAVAAPLGLRVGPQSVPSPASTLLATDPVGIVRGAHIERIEPAAVAADGEAIRLTVRGLGLAGVTGVDVEPEAGIAVGTVEVAEDGCSVGVMLTVDPAATRGARRVLLSGSVSPSPARPGVDVLRILDPSPEITSIDPTHLQRGLGPRSLALRGRHLGQVTGLRILPADDIRIASDGTAIPGGRRWLVDVGADAPPGARLVIADAPVGTSGETPSAANRLWITDAPPPVVPALTTAPIEVQVGVGEPATPRALGAASDMVGVTIGPALDGVAPRRLEVGAPAELAVTGSGLAAVDAVAFEPGEGIQVVGLLADPLGVSLRVSIDIAADAPDTWRRLRVFANGIEVPFADPSLAALRVTLPAPVIAGIEPRAIHADGGTVMLTLVGERLHDADAVLADPPMLAFGPPSVAADGRRLTVIASPVPGAGTGHTRVQVRTPAGASTRETTPANRLTLFRDARVPPSALAAPALGIVVGSAVHPSPPDVLVAAPLLGVAIGPMTPERPADRLVATPALGVVTGPFVSGVSAPSLLPGGTYDLRLSGRGLDAVDGAGLFPGLDLTLASPIPSADGTALSLRLTIPSDAEPKARELRLLANGAQVAFSDPRLAVIAVDDGPPEVHSIWPIQAEAGETLDLAIRGARLEDVTRVFAEPAAGLQFSWQYTLDPDGVGVLVRVHVDADAPPGTRTLRVETPGGVSSVADAAANRFTVH